MIAARLVGLRGAGGGAAERVGLVWWVDSGKPPPDDNPFGYLDVPAMVERAKAEYPWPRQWHPRRVPEGLPTPGVTYVDVEGGPCVQCGRTLSTAWYQRPHGERGDTVSVCYSCETNRARAQAAATAEFRASEDRRAARKAKAQRKAREKAERKKAERKKAEREAAALASVVDEAKAAERAQAQNDAALAQRAAEEVVRTVLRQAGQEKRRRR